MTIQFEIYCGLDANGHDVDTRALVERLALKYFPDGHSIRSELGRYAFRDHYGPTNDVITEETLVVTWLVSEAVTNADNLVGRMAGDYKNLAYQESVMISRREVDAIFI